jgi:hypothetical protein
MVATPWKARQQNAPDFPQGWQKNNTHFLEISIAAFGQPSLTSRKFTIFLKIMLWNSNDNQWKEQRALRPISENGQNRNESVSKVAYD